MKRIWLLVLVSVLALGTVGCGGGSSKSGSAGVRRAASSPSSSPRTLTDLRGIAQLRTLFNKASGEPRLIVLVSPT